MTDPRRIELVEQLLAADYFNANTRRKKAEEILAVLAAADQQEKLDPARPEPPPVEPSEVVERVAEALWRVDAVTGETWEHRNDDTREYYRKRARAALRTAGTHQAEALGMAREIVALLDTTVTGPRGDAAKEKARALVKLLETGSK